MNIYDYTVLDEHGNLTSLKKYRTDVLLIVNTAPGCGLAPQYEGLQALYDHYGTRGLEVLDFPCNQFGAQAPGTIKEISTYCTVNFGTTFPRFEKIEVNGPGEDPLYTFLKSKQPGPMGGPITWNFTKFLVDRLGNVVQRFEPTTPPEDIEPHIVKLLDEHPGKPCGSSE